MVPLTLAARHAFVLRNVQANLFQPSENALIQPLSNKVIRSHALPLPPVAFVLSVKGLNSGTHATHSLLAGAFANIFWGCGVGIGRQRRGLACGLGRDKGRTTVIGDYRWPVRIMIAVLFLLLLMVGQDEG